MSANHKAFDFSIDVAGGYFWTLSNARYRAAEQSDPRLRPPCYVRSMGAEATTPTTPRLDDEAASRLLHDTFRLWINPEIERRRADGRLPKGFTLWAAQVVMNIDKPLGVRLNEDIAGVLRGRLNRAVKEGETGHCSDFDAIEGFELSGHDPNAGHITVIQLKGMWLITFDFRYNAERTQVYLDAALEFLDTAAHAAAEGAVRACLENLFAATELTAKAYLLMMPDEKILQNKKHTFIARRINRESKQGNVEEDHVRLLNELGELRHRARYLQKPLTTSQQHAEMMVTRAVAFRDAVNRRAPRRAATPGKAAL